MTRERAIRIVTLLALLGVAIAGDTLRPHDEYSVKGVSYDSALARRQLRTPVMQSRRFSLQFDVSAKDAQYDNLVQLSGQSGVSLRLEVQPPHRLMLMVFGIDAVPITLTDGFMLNRWHHISISGMPNGDFDIAVDRVVSHFSLPAVRQLQSSAEIGSKNFVFQFQTIDVGSGYSPPRPLNGRIANLSFTAEYVQQWLWPLTFLAAIAICAGVLWCLWPWVAATRLPELGSSDIVIFLLLAGATGIGFLAYALAGKWAIWLAIGIGTLIAVLIAEVTRRRAFTGRPAAIAAALLVAAAAASLVTLPNALIPIRMFAAWPLLTAFSITLIFCMSAKLLESVDAAAPVHAYARFVLWIPYVIFALLALRTDSIFAPINALHWDYFVGPIRALREGGWLLWSVPSQYGFLTVLIPSVLPIQPAVDAFYWFQAFTEFAIAAVFYRTLYSVLGVHWLAAFLLVAAFFFLADPLLIGPSAYPSMGAVRFFWCYVLLAISAANFLGDRPSITRFARYGALAWIAGMFWSAESAVYSTVIYFTPLCVHLALTATKYSIKGAARAAFDLLLIPLIGALLALGLCEAVYLVALGHAPDWSMFIAYSRSYGSGYGERPIPYYGPLWLIMLILFGGAAVFVSLRNRKIAAPAYAVATALSVVWIVSSYYVGRAYPVVVTMLSPLLVFAIFTIIRAGRTLGGPQLQTAIAFPLIVLGLLSSFWNAGIPGLARSLATPNVVAWVRLPEVNRELAGVLRRAKIDPSTPVVYYDTWVAMPRASNGPFERNWLPTPLQDLEDPVPVAMRDEVITRFLDRKLMPGYFIEATGGTNSPQAAHSWKVLLSRFYAIHEVVRSENYRVLKLTPRALSKAGSSVE